MARKQRAAPVIETSVPLVVSAGDRLDVEAAEGLLEQLRQALDISSHGLAIDLGGNETAHTAAMQILVAAARACGERGLHFELTGVSVMLGASLRLAGLAGVLGLGDDTSARPASSPKDLSA